MPQAIYPSVTAGQDITADLLISMLPVWVYKTAQTDRSSTTTPTADPDLQFTMAADATYSVEIWIHYSTPAAADFRTDWTVPSGTVNRAALGLGTTVTDSTPQGIMRSGIHSSGTDVVYGDRAGANQIFCYESAVVAVTTGGTFSFNWAQGTSNAGTTSVHADSRMRIMRIA